MYVNINNIFPSLENFEVFLNFNTSFFFQKTDVDSEAELQMRRLRHESRREIRQSISILRISGSILLHGLPHEPGGSYPRENSIEMGFQ